MRITNLPGNRRCREAKMYSFFVFVALTLAGQVGNGGRYDQTPATTGPNNRTGAAGTNITPLTNSQPANNNANTRSGPTGAATSGNPYPTSPPPGFGPRSNSTSSNNGSPALGGSQSTPAATYPQQPGFPNDDAATTGQTGPSPTAMMQAMLAAPPGNQLRGEQVRLIEVISTGGSRNEQTQRVEAYWDLCSSVADYYLGLREQEELRKIGSSSTQPGESLQEAVQKFNVRLATSLRAAKASQYRLASLMTRGPNNLPLPGDLPHCGTYLTKYQEIFAGRSSLEAQELASLLPARYTELKDSTAD